MNNNFFITIYIMKVTNNFSFYAKIYNLIDLIMYKFFFKNIIKLIIYLF